MLNIEYDRIILDYIAKKSLPRIGVIGTAEVWKSGERCKRWVGINMIDNIKSRQKFISIIATCLILGCFVFVCFVSRSDTQQQHLIEFQTQYEESLLPILRENSLELLSVEYTELVPDYELDDWETERINSYEVKVYVRGNAGSYEEMYDLFIDIRSANNYLLSNTYEIMSSYAYVADDSRETGFHEVHTTLIFEDGTSYTHDFRSLLKNNTEVWKKEGKPVTEESMVNQADAAGWDCMYEDCDNKRAEGRLYCHIHKCNEPGCMHETSPLQSYCEQHRKED